MAISIPRFNPALLGDFPALKEQFFSGKPEIEYLATIPAPTPPSMSKWKTIVWLVITLPLKIIQWLALTALAMLLDAIYMPKHARQLRVTRSHSTRKVQEAISYLAWADKLRSFSLNDYRLEDDDVYTLDAIPKNKIPSAFIRENLNELVNKVGFHERIECGLCHGGANWFNYLFLLGLSHQKLADSCETYTAYGEKIASLFAKGQPKQAALIQNLYGLEKRLIPIENTLFIYSLGVDDLKLTVESIEKLPNGVYYISSGQHAVSFVKIDEERFVWDPNKGLITISKTEELTELLLSYNARQAKAYAVFYYQNLKTATPSPGLIARLYAWLKRH